MPVCPTPIFVLSWRATIARSIEQLQFAICLHKRSVFGILHSALLMLRLYLQFALPNSLLCALIIISIIIIIITIMCNVCVCLWLPIILLSLSFRLCCGRRLCFGIVFVEVVFNYNYNCHCHCYISTKYYTLVFHYNDISITRATWPLSYLANLPITLASNALESRFQ